jgi:hypothetical protein
MEVDDIVPEVMWVGEEVVSDEIEDGNEGVAVSSCMVPAVSKVCHLIF